MRERLIELLKRVGDDDNLKWYDLSELTDGLSGCADYLADYLLGNGVLTPLFSIGQTVYTFSENNNKIRAEKICNIIVSKKGFTYCIDLLKAFKSEDVGIRVFLTKEEAKKALERREQ